MALTAEDRDEIRNLLSQYNFAVDHGDDEGWAATFTDDGVFESGTTVVRGTRGLVEFVAVNRIKGARHWLSNVIIEANGDGARVRAYLAMARWEDGRYQTFATGVYDDVLARVDGRWKFKRRNFIIDDSVPDP